MKYIATGTVTGSKIIGIFEADSAANAKILAEKSGNCDISLCHNCEDECINPTITDIIVEEL